LLDYEYRKLFGMTQQELLSEPFETYQTNLTILFARGEVENRKQRHSERMSKSKI